MTFEEESNDATQVYSQGGEWSVSITDDDQRTMSSTDIAIEFGRGKLSLSDTFVWKEGMSDWLPLQQVPELMELVGGGGGRAAAAPAAPVAQAAYAPAPAASEHFAGTMMMDSPPAYPGPALAPAPSPAAFAPTAAMPAVQTAARRAAGPSVDVFQARGAETETAAERAQKMMTGARNEESSLFSLSDLHTAAAAKGAARAPVPSIERGPMAPPARKKKADDLRNMGTGDLGMGGPLPGAGSMGGGLGAFSEPMVTAPVAAPPPPPPTPVVQPLAVSAQPSASAMAAATLSAPQPKSKAGLFMGIGAVVLVGAAVGIFFATRGGGEATPTTTTQAATDKTEPKPSTTGDKVATNDTPSSATSSEPSPAGSDSAEPETSASTSASASGSASSSSSSKVAVKDPKTDKSATPATSSAPTTTTASAAKSTEPPPSGGGDFDVDAARGQLSSKAAGAQGCAQPGGPTGRGTASVTFAPSGHVSAVSISAPFGGTPVGGCLTALFRGCAVPPFAGSPVPVSKSFFIK